MILNLSFNMSEKRFERFVDEVTLMAVETIGEVCRDRTEQELLKLPRQMDENDTVTITFPVTLNALTLKAIYAASRKRKRKQRQTPLFD